MKKIKLAVLVLCVLHVGLTLSMMIPKYDGFTTEDVVGTLIDAEPTELKKMLDVGLDVNVKLTYEYYDGNSCKILAKEEPLLVLARHWGSWQNSYMPEFIMGSLAGQLIARKCACLYLLLGQKDIDVNALTSNYEDTPITLIIKKFSPYLCDNGFTLQAIKSLIDKGAFINTPDKYGNKPIDYARAIQENNNRCCLDSCLFHLTGAQDHIHELIALLKVEQKKRSQDSKKNK